MNSYGITVLVFHSYNHITSLTRRRFGVTTQVNPWLPQDFLSQPYRWSLHILWVPWVVLIWATFYLPLVDCRRSPLHRLWPIGGEPQRLSIWKEIRNLFSVLTDPSTDFFKKLAMKHLPYTGFPSFLTIGFWKLMESRHPKNTTIEKTSKFQVWNFGCCNDINSSDLHILKMYICVLDNMSITAVEITWTFYTFLNVFWNSYGNFHARIFPCCDRLLSNCLKDSVII